MIKNKIFPFIKIFWKKYNEDKIFKESAALTYVTLLGFIPFIIFLLFFIPDLSFMQTEEQISKLALSIFVPESAEMIFDYIKQIANKRIPFNLISFFILLFTSYSLFQIINSTFDNILNAKEIKSKNFLTEITRFFGMTIFGSVIILAILSAISLPIVSKYFELPFWQHLSLYLTPFLILFIIFTLGFFYIPTVKVKKRSIVIGAAVSAIIWILFKSFFNWYITTLTNIELIFGVLGAIPIFLIWIYTNWVIMLSGVIIVSILEGRHKRDESMMKDMENIKISIERTLPRSSKNRKTKSELSRKDIKEILQEILNEPKKKNEFTEKDE
ncbi:MAG: YihY family inner membrane protein [Candidatus Cloacimonetes bacterium]|jgi:YihY family inner membrane protein|nr:YihY family inner membrane protein [Candidatus Cloacimonadota bacterium]MBT4331910.1 YihY family inner membrane protein [Candidatus Cloacimonadota bacterium]MBT4575498.1 YihY family inner membrane protein [Candidatus Cloacimonadota bacterium]